MIIKKEILIPAITLTLLAAAAPFVSNTALFSGVVDAARTKPAEAAGIAVDREITGSFIRGAFIITFVVPAVSAFIFLAASGRIAGPIHGTTGAAPDLTLGETGLGTKDGTRVPAGITISGIDIGRALKRFDGNKTAFIDVLRSYAANIPSSLNDLRKYLQTENLNDYAIIVHGIKGASYGILAQETGKAAEALESAAKAGNIDAVKTGHGGFEKSMRTLIGNIDSALNKLESVNKPAAAAPDPELLLELREACGKFDMDRVDNLMARLESFRYESGGDLVAWLRKQIDNTIFEAVSDGDWPSV